MLNKTRFAGLSILLLLIAVSFWALASCGGGGGGGGGTQLTATQQAAASASAAQGAIALSANVAGSVDMASGYIPAGYAPGKGGLRAGTAAIANIDPRLKDVVDRMLAQIQKPAVQGPLAKARSFKTLSAPLSASSSSMTVPCDTGTYVITSSILTTPTSTTNTVTVAYNNCKYIASWSVLNGSLSATHTIDSAGPSDTANVTINNLTDTAYTDASFSVVSDIFSLNGTFDSARTGNLLSSSSGTASALGNFTWTIVDPVYGNVVMSFNFGSGITPISDAWTKVVSAPTTTETHTANGSYGLTVSAPGQSIALSITLANLEDKYRTNSTNGDDEWINGSVSISWSPDLSQWGCLNGTYVFTTAPGTPIHWGPFDYCPTSGTVQVNNAKIEFGKPSGYKVTVTLQPNGPSEVFYDCDSLGGGMCGSGGNASVPAPAVP